MALVSEEIRIFETCSFSLITHATYDYFHFTDPNDFNVPALVDVSYLMFLASNCLCFIRIFLILKLSISMCIGCLQ